MGEQPKPMKAEDTDFNLTIVNLVASGEIGREIDTEAVAEDIASEVVTTAPGRAYLSRSEEAPTVMLFRSGSVTVAGATSRDEAKREVEWIIDTLSEISFEIHLDQVLSSLRIKYLVLQGDFEQSLDLSTVAVALGLEFTEYEPEQFPAVIYKPSGKEYTVLIFSTGTTLVTGLKDQQGAEAVFQEVYDILSDTGAFLDL